MAANIDCGSILRRNASAINQSFIDGKINFQDAKILYNRELDAYNNCRGGASSNQVGISAGGIKYVGFDTVRNNR